MSANGSRTESQHNTNSVNNATSHSELGKVVRLALEMASDRTRRMLSREPLDEQQQATLNVNERASSVQDAEVSSAADSTLSVSGDDAAGYKTEANETRRILSSLCELASQENTNLYKQIELLVRFDELEGWRESGAKNCVSWMNSYLQIDRRSAWERLRVGRLLRDLPVINRLFQLGRLSWSKVRLLTRVANAENEKVLAHASIDATVSDVQRICEEYRWSATSSEENDSLRADTQWQRRRLNWQQLPDGSTQIRLVLPPDKAQNFLHAIEHCEEMLYEDCKDCKDLNVHQNAENLHSTDHSDNCVHSTDHSGNCAREERAGQNLTPSQRKADAAVLLAERSIAFHGAHCTPADRYQVVLNIDTHSLAQQADQSSADTKPYTRNPMIEGIGSVPVATARQIACDCSIIKLLTEQGEPLSIGRKQRIWPAPMRRAILTRDRHCQFPGCSSHRYLQIHHIKHWADGGETSVANGVCLCQYHHQLIHVGKYTIERAAIGKKSGVTTGLFSSSKLQLLPTRCRFVVKPADEERSPSLSGRPSDQSNQEQPSHTNVPRRHFRYSENEQTINRGTENPQCSEAWPVYESQPYSSTTCHPP